MLTEPKNLIVVYKDELVLNQLKKLVETNDDKEGQVVGTTDGSVTIVAWSEKVWLDNKKAGTIEDKVLLIGKIKGADKLEPIIDVKYNKWGIKYGWAGKQALIQVDENSISKEEYQKFLDVFSGNNLPEKKKKEENKLLKFGKAYLKLTTALAFPLVGAGGVAHDYFKNKGELRQQLFLYGILHLYENDLEAFMKS